MHVGSSDQTASKTATAICTRLACLPTTEAEREVAIFISDSLHTENEYLSLQVRLRTGNEMRIENILLPLAILRH